MNNDYYKKKAIKYKLKYLDLKNKLGLLGGIPVWYNKFESELFDIYRLVQNYYTTTTKPILTGSGAIAYLLNYLHMDTDLDNLMELDINPHDLDFLYISNTGLSNPDSLGIFNINPAQKRETSVTFKINSETSNNYIKSFDVSKINKINYFELNGINIINLKSLSSFYTSDFLDDDEKINKDKLKKDLIEKIIKKINDDNRSGEFGLEPINLPRIDNKRSGLFGSDSDDEDYSISNKKPNKLNYGSDTAYSKNTNQKPTKLFSDSDDEDM